VGKNRVRAVAHAEVNCHAIFSHPTSWRHCEEPKATKQSRAARDCFAALAMTPKP
jgi:hypothetical protein